MRTLPLTISPFPGETTSSVFLRLARRNGIPAKQLWKAMRHAESGLAYAVTPERVPNLVAELAGLPAGHFDQPRPTELLYARCAHARWAHLNCPECGSLPSAVAMCRRCARGEVVEVRARAGAVCTRHRRWCYAGADEDLTGEGAYFRAERCLVGSLWQRGISLHTGELQLATELIYRYRAIINGEPKAVGYPEQLRAVFPHAVRLVALLTEPWAENFLAGTRPGRLCVLAIVEASVMAIEQHSGEGVTLMRESFQCRDRETQILAGGTQRLRVGRSPDLGPVGQSLRGMEHRLRSTFLRHTDARRPDHR